jgi:hypothetical protein
VLQIVAEQQRTDPRESIIERLAHRLTGPGPRRRRPPAAPRAGPG